MQRSTDKIRRDDIIRRERASKMLMRKRTVRRRIILIAVMALIIVAFAAAGILIYKFHPVFLKNKVVNQELKEAFDPEDNIRYVVGGKASQVEVTGEVDTSTTGDYPVEYRGTETGIFR